MGPQKGQQGWWQGQRCFARILTYHSVPIEFDIDLDNDSYIYTVCERTRRKREKLFVKKGRKETKYDSNSETWCRVLCVMSIQSINHHHRIIIYLFLMM